MCGEIRHLSGTQAYKAFIVNNGIGLQMDHTFRTQQNYVQDIEEELMIYGWKTTRPIQDTRNYHKDKRMPQEKNNEGR